MSNTKYIEEKTSNAKKIEKKTSKKKYRKTKYRIMKTSNDTNTEERKCRKC